MCIFSARFLLLEQLHQLEEASVLSDAQTPHHDARDEEEQAGGRGGPGFPLAGQSLQDPVWQSRYQPREDDTA